MKTNVTTCIVIDTRRKRSDCLYQIKLRVTFNRYSKYYATDYALSKSDFEKVMGKAPRRDFKITRQNLVAKEKMAREIIEDLPEFNFNEFEIRYLNKSIRTNDIIALLNEKVTFLYSQDRIKTARSYKSTLSSFQSFTRRNKLPINRITVKFLKDYESWMLNQGKSITTVGIYCRNLRSIINSAIADGIIKQKDYPFGRRKYQIPASRNIKKALNKQDILKIIGYKPKNEIEAYSRDMWLFSYLANGMNFTDIANLKIGNIHGDFLIFNRSKTRTSTRSKPKLVKVFILNEMRAIIDRYGKYEALYLFSILKPGMNIEQQVDKIELTIRSINRHMGKIANSLGIEKKVKTGTARHSFSTVLKRSGASIEYISEALGHQTTTTTRHYLDSFDDDEKRKWSEKLL